MENPKQFSIMKVYCQVWDGYQDRKDRFKDLVI